MYTGRGMNGGNGVIFGIGGVGITGFGAGCCGVTGFGAGCEVATIGGDFEPGACSMPKSFCEDPDAVNFNAIAWAPDGVVTATPVGEVALPWMNPEVGIGTTVYAPGFKASLGA